jgi:protoheme IX farnesyltransferase
MGWTLTTNGLGGFGSYLFGILFLWQIPHFMAISLYRKSEYSSARFLTFAQTHSFSFLRWNIIIYSILLMLFGMIPYLADWRGEGYLIASLMISVIFLVLAVGGLFFGEEDRQKTWARVYFFGTLFYLPLILGILLVLR